jgi:hypothetical protein
VKKKNGFDCKMPKKKISLPFGSVLVAVPVSVPPSEITKENNKENIPSPGQNTTTHPTLSY